MGLGALGFCAFPPVDWGFCGWVFPGLWVVGAGWVQRQAVKAGGKPTGRKVFGFGYGVGLVFWLLDLYWLLYNPFPSGAVAGWLALSAYLALYPAVFVWGIWKGLEAIGPKENPERGGYRWRWSEVPWVNRQILYAWGALLWVALEMVRARFLSGFPWNFLGVSQHAQIGLLWIARWTGVYGVSACVVWGSLGLIGGVVVAWERLRARTKGFQTLFRPFWGTTMVGLETAPMWLVIGGIWLHGIQEAWKEKSPSHPSISLRVAMVQPSIPQRLIFDPNEAAYRYRVLLRLTRQALKAKPDLVVWPEASLPNLSQEQYEALFAEIRQAGVWFVFGAEDAVPVPGGSNRFRYYNAAFLCSPEGEIVQVYHKRHLVPFGEMIPLERWIPWMRYLTPIPESLTPGDRPVRFQISVHGREVGLAPLICFEDVFPHLVREHARLPGVQVLLNMTNDGWFGESAAQWQHAWNAMFRAVENGILLLRCGNNGLTCWFDTQGRFRGHENRSNRSVYAPQIWIWDLPVPVRSQPTYYTRYGDRFGWTCTVLGMLGLGGWILAGRRRGSLFQTGFGLGKRMTGPVGNPME